VLLGLVKKSKQQLPHAGDRFNTGHRNGMYVNVQIFYSD